MRRKCFLARRCVTSPTVNGASTAGRAPAQIRRALANREVEALHERGVQGLGILRRQQRGLQPTRRADFQASLDPDDTIVPPSLEHLTIDTRRPKEAPNHPDVVLKALRPGFPQLSHPGVAHAIPSIAFIAQVFWGTKPVVSAYDLGVKATDQQRPEQAPSGERLSKARAPAPAWCAVAPTP